MSTGGSTRLKLRVMRRAVVGKKLSRLGEVIGWEALVYNPIHFLHFHDAALADAHDVLDVVERTFPDAQTYLDVGAGSGAYAAEAMRRGHPTVALEHNRFGRYLAGRQGVDVRPFDLADPPALLSFDLAYCFEVAEHLPAQLGDRLVQFLAESGHEILFTAAPPGQGGTGHINEQPSQYWHERFAHYGKVHDRGRSDAIREQLARRKLASYWLANNAIVYS